MKNTIIFLFLFKLFWCSRVTFLGFPKIKLRISSIFMTVSSDAKIQILQRRLFGAQSILVFPASIKNFHLSQAIYCS